MTRFWEIGQNVDFWPKMAIFDQKRVQNGSKILMYDGLLEAYGRVVWLSCKNNFGGQFSPLSGGKNGKKNGHFWPKISVSANFSKFGHWIFLVLQIWTVFWIYFWKNKWKFQEKSGFGRFVVFWSKIHCMWWHYWMFEYFWLIAHPKML